LPRSAQRRPEQAPLRSPTAPPATQEDAPGAEDVERPEPPEPRAPTSRPARPRATLTEIAPTQPPQRSAETPPSRPSPRRVPGPMQAKPAEPAPAPNGDEVESLPPEAEEAAPERAEWDTLEPVSGGVAADVPELVETPQIGTAGTDTVRAAPAEDRLTATREPQPPDDLLQRVPEQPETVPSVLPDLPDASRTEPAPSSAQPTASDAQPAVPDVWQAEPDAQQAEPGAQPLAPDERSGPAAHALVAGAQPTMPTVQPEAFDVQPGVSSAELPEPAGGQEAERVTPGTVPAGEGPALVARSPETETGISPGDVVQRAVVPQAPPSAAPLQATEDATPQEALVRRPPAPASPSRPAPPIEALVQRPRTGLPGAPAFQVQQAPESRGVEPPSMTSREAKGWMASPPEATRQALVQRSIDSREALRQALQPRMVPSVVQTAPQEAEAQTEDTGETPEESGQVGQDLDALARDVYRIIRRRLLVERERELGRL
jgi:hypothetical protein